MSWTTKKHPASEYPGSNEEAIPAIGGSTYNRVILTWPNTSNTNAREWLAGRVLRWN